LETVLAGLTERRVRPDDLDEADWERFGGRPDGRSLRLDELLRRPQVTLPELRRFWPELDALAQDVVLEAETRTKYEGYLRRQEELAGRMGRLENVRLPADIDYAAVSGLSRESSKSSARWLRPPSARPDASPASRRPPWPAWKSISKNGANTLWALCPA